MSCDGNPEEDDVKTCHQHISQVEGLKKSFSASFCASGQPKVENVQAQMRTMCPKRLRRLEVPSAAMLFFATNSSSFAIPRKCCPSASCQAGIRWPHHS